MGGGEAPPFSSSKFQFHSPTLSVSPVISTNSISSSSSSGTTNNTPNLMFDLEGTTKEETQKLIAAQIKHLELMQSKLNEGVPVKVVHKMIAASKMNLDGEDTGGKSPGHILFDEFLTDDDEEDEEEEEELNQSL
jgi:hypothetical protein